MIENKKALNKQLKTFDILKDCQLVSKIADKIEKNLKYPFPIDLVWPAFLYFWVGQDNVSIEDFDGYLNENRLKEM